MDVKDRATLEDVKNKDKDKWVSAETLNESIRTIGDVGSIVYSDHNLELETNGQYIACDGRTLSIGTYPEYENSGVELLLPEFISRNLNFNNSGMIPVYGDVTFDIGDYYYRIINDYKTLAKIYKPTFEVINTVDITQPGITPGSSAKTAVFTIRDEVYVFIGSYNFVYDANLSLVSGVRTLPGSIGTALAVFELFNNRYMVWSDGWYALTDTFFSSFITIISSAFQGFPIASVLSSQQIVNSRTNILQGDPNNRVLFKWNNELHMVYTYASNAPNHIYSIDNGISWSVRPLYTGTVTIDDKNYDINVQGNNGVIQFYNTFALGDYYYHAMVEVSTKKQVLVKYRISDDTIVGLLQTNIDRANASSPVLAPVYDCVSDQIIIFNGEPYYTEGNAVRPTGFLQCDPDLKNCRSIPQISGYQIPGVNYDIMTFMTRVITLTHNKYNGILKTAANVQYLKYEGVFVEKLPSPTTGLISPNYAQRIEIISENFNLANGASCIQQLTDHMYLMYITGSGASVNQHFLDLDFTKYRILNRPGAYVKVR